MGKSGGVWDRAYSRKTVAVVPWPSSWVGGSHDDGCVVRLCFREATRPAPLGGGGRLRLGCCACPGVGPLAGSHGTGELEVRPEDALMRCRSLLARHLWPLLAAGGRGWRGGTSHRALVCRAPIRGDKARPGAKAAPPCPRLCDTCRRATAQVRCHPSLQRARPLRLEVFLQRVHDLIGRSLARRDRSTDVTVPDVRGLGAGPVQKPRRRSPALRTSHHPQARPLERLVTPTGVGSSVQRCSV